MPVGDPRVVNVVGGIAEGRDKMQRWDLLHRLTLLQHDAIDFLVTSKAAAHSIVMLMVAISTWIVSYRCAGKA